MTNENEAQNQNLGAADSPYVAEKPTLWSRLSKPRKAALVTGGAIAVASSLFAVNFAIASANPDQPPLFGDGGRHQLPGFAPNAIAPTGIPQPGDQLPNGFGGDGDAVGLPPIHGIPPMAIHPEEGSSDANELDQDAEEFGEQPHPPRDHGDREGREHHGEEHNESNEGDDD